VLPPESNKSGLSRNLVKRTAKALATSMWLRPMAAIAVVSFTRAPFTYSIVSTFVHVVSQYTSGTCDHPTASNVEGPSNTG
jgi:hypothetical protein